VSWLTHVSSGGICINIASENRQLHRSHNMPRDTRLAGGGVEKKKNKANKVKRTKVTTEGEVFTMPPGRYYVGDPVYVLDDETYAELCKDYTKDGKTILSDGRTVVSYHCPFGDGMYFDKNRKMYLVDSGCLGMTLLEGLEEQWEPDHANHPGETFMKYILRVGNIVEYDSEFHVKNVTVKYEHYKAVRMSFGKEISIKA
jgi:hypothetical protein